MIGSEKWAGAPLRKVAAKILRRNKIQWPKELTVQDVFDKTLPVQQDGCNKDKDKVAKLKRRMANSISFAEVICREENDIINVVKP